MQNPKYLFVKQIGCPTFVKIGYTNIPQFFERLRRFAALDRRQNLGIYEQSSVAVDLPFGRVKFPQSGGDLDAGSDRI